MNLVDLQMNLSLRSKNGLAFLLSGIVVWIIITIIYVLPIELKFQNIFMLSVTALLFPLAVFISKIINADWKSKDNPLGTLGLYLNLAQVMYFPLIFWALFNSPEEMVSFFAIIAGAHFFPFGWLYRANAYYLLAPIMSVLIFVISAFVHTHFLWHIPLTMVLLLTTLVVLLHFDYKRKLVFQKENH